MRGASVHSGGDGWPGETIVLRPKLAGPRPSRVVAGLFAEPLIQSPYRTNVLTSVEGVAGVRRI